ncbi:sigma-70 family RNA polymerase sigma factor [Membranicola marinus]|uniref:Sigma-70 family RNA polymerase sigma factor n=1 Tax=Membranihabitans marinus TaxID=1227546 RepID=A0A953HQT4_9BACT|nr:sigma-70 family RNA polymerase sigma factor [Membranihabitans marinus]MBY5959168.1 sigma-70 family RNA polymerase sigma factor [Membranihabitans marinus]
MASKKEKSNELIVVLKHIAEGKEEAIRSFYLDHYNQFINYGRTITQDRHAVEDAIQQLLIWIVENPRKARRLDRPDVYFFRSLRNNLIKEQMASRKDLQDKLRETLSEMMITKSAEKKWMENEEEQEIIDRLQKEIRTLPDYLQQTLYLRFFSNLEYKDISSIMEIKPNVARIYIHRAIERLRSTLKL